MMKCSACGKENLQDARFCAFCGAKISSDTQTQEATHREADDFSQRVTARPLNDNPYQPRRPMIPPHPAAAAVDHAPKASQAFESTNKPSQPKVFLFDEEEEEAKRQREMAMRREQMRLKWEREQDLEEGFDDDYDEDMDEEEEEEEAPSSRIFVRVFSVLTVLALVVGIVSFLYGTTIGRRLRASIGMSSDAQDYLILANWQLAQNDATSAANSYHNALKLAPDDYDLALKVGEGFENAGDMERAEQLYVYLIEKYPEKDEPYDCLMALLNRQDRQSEYEALIDYRSQHQSGYVAPTLPPVDAPTANMPGGQYSGSVQIKLDAGGNEIRYTLDGTTPSAESLQYTGPISLFAGTYTIRAIAIKGSQVSPEWSASYIVQ